MGEYRELLFDYVNDFQVREYDDFAVVAIPVFFGGHDESIAIRIEKIHCGYTFSDCHSVNDYWEFLDVDVEKYADKINRVLDVFGVSFDEDKCLISTIQSESQSVIRNFFGYFLQAVFILGNVENLYKENN